VSGLTAPTNPEVNVEVPVGFVFGLLGRNGDSAQATGWWMIDQGLCHLVASDGHRASRPPYLDRAFAAVAARITYGRIRDYLHV